MIEVLRVEQPGILTTIQDLGRPNAVASGVQAGGAMDRFAHSAANLLVGNDRAAAALECTLTGPRLVALRSCVVAITGGDLGPSIPMWTATWLEAGDRLTFRTRRFGARAYIAVAGGVVGDRWLGSTSTNLLCARGGMHGRALVAGDVIHAGGAPESALPGRALPAELRPLYTDHGLGAVAGPHIARLRQPFFGKRFALSLDSNRMGYRLDGPRLETAGGELLSFPVIGGNVQLPAGGQPILLMADCQTAGGYPVIATVAGAWMPVAAQLAPGDELTFTETSIEDALKQRTAQREALDSLIS